MGEAKYCIELSEKKEMDLSGHEYKNLLLRLLEVVKDDGESITVTPKRSYYFVQTGGITADQLATMLRKLAEKIEKQEEV